MRTCACTEPTGLTLRTWERFAILDFCFMTKRISLATLSDLHHRRRTRVVQSGSSFANPAPHLPHHGLPTARTRQLPQPQLVRCQPTPPLAHLPHHELAQHGSLQQLLEVHAQPRQHAHGEQPEDGACGATQRTERVCTGLRSPIWLLGYFTYRLTGRLRCPWPQQAPHLMRRPTR